MVLGAPAHKGGPCGVVDYGGGRPPSCLDGADDLAKEGAPCQEVPLKCSLVMDLFYLDQETNFICGGFLWKLFGG